MLARYPKKRNFWIFYALSFLIVAILGISGVYFYTSYHQNLIKDLNHSTKLMSSYLQNVIALTESRLVNISENIKKSPKNVYEILTNLKEHNINGMNYDLFWISPDLQLTFVTSRLGKQHYDLSQHDSLKKILESTEKLYVLSSELVVNSSGLRETSFIIPVISASGVKLGFLGMNLNSFNIVQRINDLVSDSHFSYVILNSNLKIVLCSPDCPLSYESSYFRDKFLGKSEILFSDEFGVILNSIIIKDVKYNSYGKIKNHSLYILIGENRLSADKRFEMLIIPRVAEMLVLSFLVVIFMYLFRQRFLAVADASESARELFIKTLKMQMQEILDRLFSDCLKLKNFQEEHAYHNSALEEIVNSIISSSKTLEILSSEKTPTILLDVNETLKYCKLIVEHYAFVNGVTIKLHLSPSIPLISIKEIIFKQAIVGIISLAIKYFSDDNVIKISTETVENNYVKIVLQGRGGLDFDRIKHFERNNESICTSYAVDLRFSLNAIQRLIDSMNGQLALRSQKNDKTKFIEVILPCDSQ